MRASTPPGAQAERHAWPGLAALSCIAMCCAVLFASAANAQAPQGGAGPTEQDPLTARREVALAAQLRCLVCQNQSIAESNAELAQDLRRQIREQMAQGRSDADIIDFMTARYGDFVLYRPPLKSSTLLLWLGPLLGLLAGGVVLARVVKGRSASRAAPLSDVERSRVDDLLHADAAAPAAAAAPASSARDDASRARGGRR